MFQRFNFFILLYFISCTHPNSSFEKTSSYYIIFNVSSRHLDYSSAKNFLSTMSKYKDFGHSWIFLYGDGKVLEGGHSGELGEWQPRYLDGVFENIERGAKNPIAYLWCEQCDGFFQKGNGGHKATFSLKINLTKEQYEKIFNFIENYSFKSFSITRNNCATFLQKVASLIDLPLEVNVTIPIEQKLYIWGTVYTLYEDEKYSKITFGSPDRLEMSLKSLLKSKEPVLSSP